MTGDKPTETDPTETSIERRLAQLHWQIERYDRLRGSVASRASYVLSANALVLTGTALAVNQLHDKPLGLRISALGVAALVVGCVSASVWGSIGALATLSPRFQEGELARGAYGWSTADRHSSTYEQFCEYLAAEDSLEAARAELFVTMKQQAHRYRRLRLAMSFFLAALAGFTLLVTLGAAAGLL
jgi:hypothetical protein